MCSALVEAKGCPSSSISLLTTCYRVPRVSFLLSTIIFLYRKFSFLFCKTILSKHKSSPKILPLENYILHKRILYPHKTCHLTKCNLTIKSFLTSVINRELSVGENEITAFYDTKERIFKGMLQKEKQVLQAQGE